MSDDKLIEGAVENMNPGDVIHQGLTAIAKQLAQARGDNIQLAAMMANTAALLLTAGPEHTATPAKVSDFRRLLVEGEKACMEMEGFIVAVSEGIYVEPEGTKEEMQ